MSNNQQWGNICHRVDCCALSGAAAFVAGIPGAEVLVNGPLWCYFYALRTLDHVKHDMGERFHNCQPDNNAILYGTEKIWYNGMNTNSNPKRSMLCLKFWKLL